MKILSIFNTFGASREESEAQVRGYEEGLSSILMQRGVDHDIVLSSCLNTAPTRNHLMEVFDDSIFYSFIDQCEPLPVTVNLTVMKMEEKYGPYDGYLYIDSGIRLTEDDQIAKLAHIHSDNNAAMTSGLTDNDTGIFEGLQFGRFVDDHENLDSLFTNGIYRIPVGRAVSLHFMIFDKSIYAEFNRIYTDLFASHTSESSFSFICASLHKPWILTNTVKVLHTLGLDGQSGGFSPSEWVRKGNSRFDHPYKVNSVVEIFNRGKEFGLGLQIWDNVVVPDIQDKFDAEGGALDPRLKDFIRDNLFLSKDLLNYDTIKCQLIKL